MQKVWLEHYPQDVAHEINSREFESLNELFEKRSKEYASRTAYSNFGVTLTYHEIDKQSRAFAAFLLHQYKLKKGDRVGVMLPNILQFPIVFFGILRAGLIAVNINPLYTTSELTHIVKDSGIETIIILSQFASTVEKALPNLNLKNIVITQFGDLFPLLKKTIFHFVLKYIKKSIPAFHIPQAVSFTKAIKTGSRFHFKHVQVQANDIALLQYTGGTTGVVKGAILTHHNLLANIAQVAAWIRPVRLSGKEIFITALPLYHIFSLTANILTGLYFGACNVLITNPRDIPHFIKTLSSLPFTVITGVNTLFRALINHPDFKYIDFSHLKIALGGGMALQTNTALRWEKITGKPLYEAYGLSEASPGVAIDNLAAPPHHGSVGFPLPSTEISIRDPEGKPLGLNEAGELWIRGPQVTCGYWHHPEETKAVLSEDGWLDTGDIASVNEEGLVHIVDRKKDIIIVSGFNVYPNEVEDVISSHPGVLETGVVGVTSRNGQERVKAFIVKKDPKLTKAEITHYCRKHLASYKVPKIIEFTEDLPKTQVGKILRRALRRNSPKPL